MKQGVNHGENILPAVPGRFTALYRFLVLVLRQLGSDENITLEYGTQDDD
jgi:hypothetical protein